MPLPRTKHDFAKQLKRTYTLKDISQFFGRTFRVWEDVENHVSPQDLKAVATNPKAFVIEKIKTLQRAVSRLAVRWYDDQVRRWDNLNHLSLDQLFVVKADADYLHKRKKLDNLLGELVDACHINKTKFIRLATCRSEDSCISGDNTDHIVELQVIVAYLRANGCPVEGPGRFADFVMEMNMRNNLENITSDENKHKAKVTTHVLKKGTERANPDFVAEWQEYLGRMLKVLGKSKYQDIAVPLGEWLEQL